MLSRRTGLWFLAGVTICVILAACVAPRIAQPPSYHHFADSRGWMGIANFGDVASNIGFAVVGIWGLWFTGGNSARGQFVDRRERWVYAIVFAGMVLTAFGSGYYHLAPDNARLVWDRLPMAIVFMALVAANLMERVSARAGLALLPVLLAIGIASVLQWYWSELHGAGDLRFYGAVQAYAVLLLVVILFLPPRYTRGSDLLIVVACYVLAKVSETFDAQIFSIGHAVSGHTIKHLAAAAGGYWILRMLQNRAH